MVKQFSTVISYRISILTTTHGWKYLCGSPTEKFQHSVEAKKSKNRHNEDSKGNSFTLPASALPQAAQLGAKTDPSNCDVSHGESENMEELCPASLAVQDTTREDYFFLVPPGIMRRSVQLSEPALALWAWEKAYDLKNYPSMSKTENYAAGIPIEGWKKHQNRYMDWLKSKVSQ